jgi:DNA-binding MarR family transcriptional regulator
MATSDLLKLLESLHPLENKVLLCFDRGEKLSAGDILEASGLDESRLDMASGWLQSKSLLEVKDESVTSLVSLTETGEEYHKRGTPENRIINALKEGKQFTVKDVIQTWGMDPSEVSSAAGALKASNVITIGQGASSA